MKILLSLSVFLMMFGVSAHAADVFHRHNDVSVTDIGEPVGDNWTGFYGSANVGMINANHDVKFGNSELDGLSSAGYLAGVEAGYRRQFGVFVIGASVEYNFVDAATSVKNWGEAKHGDDVRALGMLGIASGRMLFYGQGGYAWSSYKIDAADMSQDYRGPVAGAGIDYKLTSDLTVGLNYQHLFASNVKWTECVSDKDDENVVRAKVGYIF